MVANLTVIPGGEMSKPSTFLDETKDRIRKRIEELRPQHEEFLSLTDALAALDPGTPGTSTSTSTSQPAPTTKRPPVNTYGVNPADYAIGNWTPSLRGAPPKADKYPDRAAKHKEFKDDIERAKAEHEAKNAA